MDEPTPRATGTAATGPDPAPTVRADSFTATADIGATAPAASSGERNGPAGGGSGALGRVPIEIVISVGRSRPTIRELLQLQRDSVLPLDRRISDPVDLLVGERLIARGVLEELDGARAGLLGVRLTEVIDMREGL